MDDKARILIVDDDEGTRKSLALILRKKGYATETAATGQEALEKARERAFNLAFLDIRLPDMEGVDLIASLKEMQPYLAVIMITGYVSVGTAVQALNEGASGYVTKPVNMGELLATAREALEKQQLGEEKRRAESQRDAMLEALAEERKLLRTLIDNLPDLIFVKDVESRFVVNNIAHVHALGATTPDEVIGKTDRDLFPRELAEQYYADERAVISTGQAILDKEEIVEDQNTGNRIWVSVTKVPLWDQQGNITGLVGISRNITARKRAEAEIRRRNRELELLNRVIAATASEQEPEAMLEAACRELAGVFDVPQAAAALLNEEKTAAVVVAEYSSAVLRQSSEHRRAEGRPWALNESIPVRGNPSFEYLLTHKAPLVVDDAQPVGPLLGNDPRPAPIHHLTRSGQRGAASLLILPLVIKGEVVGSLGLDALEPRQFSAAEVGLAWSVADQVSGALARARLARERQRLEDRYHQAQKMEAVGQLTAGIAHDFNNLLTVINGFAELIQFELSPEDPVQELVGKVLHSGGRAADLVRQLLAFSRKQVIQPQVLDLNCLVVETEKMLQRVISEDIELRTALAPGLWPIRVDPAQMEQVIVNLAVNARDAMPGGGELTIETANVVLDEGYVAGHLEARPGEYMLLAVSDTGVGMSKEVQARIFEPFFTTKERGEGTGLGLATVYGIIKQNGGDIQVYSEVGVGTTFRIYLPRAGEAAQPLHRPEPVEEIPRGEETILLVEDDAGVRELAWLLLQEWGYNVLVAGDGQEALRLAAGHAGPIHLLLTDVVMPRLSGKALADQLRSSRPEMRVLYTSGYTDNAIAQHGVLEEGVHFLSKPFEMKALARKVRDVLDATHSG